MNTLICNIRKIEINQNQIRINLFVLNNRLNLGV